MTLNGELQHLTPADPDSAARQRDLETAETSLRNADDAVAAQRVVIAGLEELASDADAGAQEAADAVALQEQEISRLPLALADRQG